LLYAASGAESHLSVKAASGKSEVENTSLAHQVAGKPFSGNLGSGRDQVKQLNEKTSTCNWAEVRANLLQQPGACIRLPVAKSQGVPDECVVAPTLVFQRKDPFEPAYCLEHFAYRQRAALPFEPSL
jgi:hypothetical protein